MTSRVGKVALGLTAALAAGVLAGAAYMGAPYLLASEKSDRGQAQASVNETKSPSPSQSLSPTPKPTPTAKPTPSAKPTQSTKPTPSTKPSSAQPVGPCAETGPDQLAVEQYLANHPQFGTVTVDGKQSAQDCAAIKKFQQRYGIDPDAGYAGPVTKSVTTRLANAATDTCQTGSGTTVCVDLTSQTMWVVQGRDTVLGPTPIRTGRDELETPAGKFKIQDKLEYTISTIFNVPLPYWQRFYADMGFHETPSYLYEGDSPGSHGCINLLPSDAVDLFELTESGTPVHIFGRKPGT